MKDFFNSGCLPFFLGFIAMIGISCSERKSTDVSPEVSAFPEEHVESGDEQQFGNIPVAYTVSEAISFSNPESKDSFILNLTGSNFLESECQFLILSANKDTLYKDSWKGEELLDAGVEGRAHEHDAKEYILHHMNRFLDKVNFLSPAIRKDEPFNPKHSDSDTWNDIRSVKNAIGFHYVLNEKESRRIAYDPKKKKVMVYFHCCK